MEYKIDGLSMSLRYENGELILAETRGDGINFGEDVTANAKVIKDVKQKLKDKPEYLEIRGEVYMKNAAFEKVNETQELLGKKSVCQSKKLCSGNTPPVRQQGDERAGSFHVYFQYPAGAWHGVCNSYRRI